MKDKLEEVKITSYSGGVPEEKTILAYVFGDWMTHKPLAGDDALREDGMKWVITHKPTSALAYVSKKVGPAKEACRRLDKTMQPDSQVARRENGMFYLTTLSLEYIRASSQAVSGLEIWYILHNRYIEPEEVYPMAREIENRKVLQSVSVE